MALERSCLCMDKRRNIFKKLNKRYKSDTEQIIGFHPVIEAIEAGKYLSRVFFKTGLKGELFQECFSLVRKHKIPFQYVPAEKLSQFSRANHQGIIALVSPIPYHDLAQIVPSVYESGRSPFLLILDGITDIRNFGAIARSAEASGVDAIIVGSRKTALINSDAVKTSSGALNRIPVCREDNLENTVTYLKESGIKIIGATEKAEQVYYQTDLSGPAAIVMGAEDSGISTAILRQVDQLVRIPMAGTIASLNVSVAAGIILFEVLKQRTQTNQ